MNNLRRIILSAAIGTVVLGAHGAYTEFPMPVGTKNTTVMAINESGAIAGNYTNAASVDHGFAWIGASFTTLTPAGYTSSFVCGMTATNRVVGECKVNNFTTLFTWAPSTGTSVLNVPSAVSCRFVAMAPDGRIVGYYEDISGAPHAFTWHNGTFTDLTPAGSSSSKPTALNAANQIVGIHRTAGNSIDQPCLWTSGTFKKLPLPPNAQGGAPQAINDGGTIVGSFQDNTLAAAHACVWIGGNVAPIELHPDGIAYGVNTFTRIVGRYTDAMNHSRPATWSGSSAATMTPIGPASITFSSSPLLAESGFIAGTCLDAGNASRAYIWTNGFFAFVAPAGSAESYTFALNKGSQSVGGYVDGAGSKASAFTWKDGATYRLLPPGASDSIATVINDAGLIAGTSVSASGAYSVFTATAEDGTVVAIQQSPAAAPTLVIKGKKKITTKKAKLKIRGTAAGSIDRVSYTIGRKTRMATGSATWNFKARLEPGKNRITVTAAGPGGISKPVRVVVKRK